MSETDYLILVLRGKHIITLCNLTSFTAVGESESETMPLSEVVNKKKKLEQASPDSLASELNREDADPEDNGNMGDVEQVRVISPGTKGHDIRF